MKRALILVFLVAVLPACGGSSQHARKAAYERQMTAIVRPAQVKMFKLRFALEQVRSPRIAQRQLRAVETILRSGASKLAAIAPPTAVADQHSRLIRAYRDLARDFQQALGPETKQRTTDTLRVQAGKFASSAGIKEVANALEAIMAKGYDLGLGSTSS